MYSVRCTNVTLTILVDKVTSALDKGDRTDSHQKHLTNKSETKLNQRNSPQ